MNKAEIEDFLWLKFNSFNRFEGFIEIASKLQGGLYWHALRTAYTDTDNLYYYKDLIKIAFQREEPNRSELMNPNELEFYNSLPEEVEIYRGLTIAEQNSKNFGVSWTLKKEVAEFFAYKYLRNFSTEAEAKTVQHLIVNKKNIIAYFNGRDEHEVIYIN
jgi:hypothetical protein